MKDENRRDRFEEAVRKYTPRIFKMIYNMTGEYENTRDLTQDVFMKAWKAFGDFRGDSSIYTWVYRIALNRVFQYRRKKSHSKTISIEETGPLPFDSNPEKNLLDKTEKRMIREIIKEIPRIHQEVLILRYYEGNAYSTIADILNIPIGTVRSRLHRGIATITKIIKERK